MGIMKRGRVDEIQYGQRSSGTSAVAPAPHHRILTSQHTGGSIQYQLTSSPGILKSSNESSSSVGNIGLGQQPPNVQYTTTYASSISSGGITKNVVSQGAGVGGNSPNATGPLHVSNTSINSVNSLRHKSGPTGGSIPINSQVAAVGPQSGTPNPPRLKVEDALSYLDQVKYQYADQPQIYNNFLDIMKEFKSQCIDTPGVIQRVSSLFKGHPDLIYGFNMFLPPGYKIEIQSNDQGISVPVVSMPSPPGGSLSCMQQSSPAHKAIVHQIPSNAVNLMTTSNPGTVTVSSGNIIQNLHTNLSPPQQSPVSQIGGSTAIPQNYSRDRERAIPHAGGISVALSGQSPNDLSNQGHNLHHISQSILQGETGGQQNQPVEFNHAITYVNKIKNRFQNTPEKYKKFLEILHTYQKEQKVLKDGTGTITQGKTLTEAEVYAQVAKLFDQNEDLLREFGQFLPDATNHSTAQYMTKAHNDNKKVSATATVGSSTHSTPSTIKSYNTTQNNIVRIERDHYDKEYHVPREKDRNHINQKFSHNVSQAKKSPSFNSVPVAHIPRRADDRENGPPPKRHKPICRDIAFSEASRYGTLADAAFFDKVRKALKCPEVYENFLRCLTLFNQEIVSKSELLAIVSPFLMKFPELHRWFQDFLGPPNIPEGVPLTVAQRQDRNQGGELAQEIDLASCKRLGASYCALPKTTEPKKCSGRTSLCREVLNDTWVSFPTWASEDSTFVTSRKTQFEEIIYRCEDERFELDVVIETNSSTIQVLEAVQRKMSRMSQEDVQRYRLDDCLGGNSPTIHQRAIRRIYGDKATEIIQGLKKNPFVCVPVVLKRLRAKEDEWREAQKNFNKQWKEQYEKYYLKSLDHQAINFKPNDIKALRSKSLFNEIETLYDERHEQNEDSPSEPITGPHMVLPYKDKTILDDAANLLIHHVKRQTGIQKQEKTKIKHIIRQFVPDLFFSPRQPLSDDEKDDAFPFLVDEKDLEIESSGEAQSKGKPTNFQQPGPSTSASIKFEDIKREVIPSTSTALNSKITNLYLNNKINSNCSNAGNNEKEMSEEYTQDVKINPALLQHANSVHFDEAYTLFFANNNWYIFLRLHAILCERLRTMYEKAQILAMEELKYRTKRRESTATALRLKQKNEVQVEDYYPTFLEMLRNVLDGNMDSNSYEDSLREMFGIHAYIAFTLDRVVSNAVRQLQHCVTERGALECIELFHTEHRKGGGGGLCRTAHKRLPAELAYQAKAEANFQEENCFKIYIYKIDCRVTIELLDTENEDPGKCVANSQAWNKFVERLSNPAVSGNISHSASGTSTSENFSGNSKNSGTEGNSKAGNNQSTSRLNKTGDKITNVEIKKEKQDIKTNISPRKPLYLRRNIRKFNSHFSTTTSSSTATATIPITSTTISPTSSTTTIVTQTTASKGSKKTKIASSLEKTLKNTTDSTINNDELIKSRVNELSNSGGTSSSINNSSTNDDKNDIVTSSNTGNVPPLLGSAGIVDPFWGKKLPDRMGQGIGVNDLYVINDREEVKINHQTYKMLFIVNKNVTLYKKNSLRKSKQRHAALTRLMQTKFQKFIDKWLEKNVSELQQQQCNDWLLGHSPDLTPHITKVIQENDILKTPYKRYNRYKVERISS